MNYLNGPLLAFMFPETDSRQLALEASLYWIQHALMVIIPIYLLKTGGKWTVACHTAEGTRLLKSFLSNSLPAGVYNMEALNDFTWNVIGYAALIIYHFGVLQIAATVSTACRARVSIATLHCQRCSNGYHVNLVYCSRYR